MRVFVFLEQINDDIPGTNPPTGEVARQRQRRARRYQDIRQLLPDVDQPTPLVRLNRIAPDLDI